MNITLLIGIALVLLVLAGLAVRRALRRHVSSQLSGMQPLIERKEGREDNSRAE